MNRSIIHLKGFTILEALISLMLMSIIVTITYSLFNLIGKQLSLFEKENVQVLEYNLFNSALINDIKKANDFSFSDNELSLKYYDGTYIYYSINKRNILRKHTIKTDTFNLQTTDYKLLNEDKNAKTQVLLLSLSVLNDTVNTNYFFKKDRSKMINQKYFSED
ncbi:prepilin-type N-terminal cleavage/methylation domain-containing protein [Flavivirga aquimarina]|uniref:Prepilin-type N-terminal cleavage/methylation domain-containing protein n=1 Tax=Flavivirga aquimarina TaxID=2027862 RepID=A0ABT8W798_9FLAO|nr:prepilin-type N-terminal cleavage/methylation domain-containing protein [Flavivirga aquimarina]MDO5968990.1 prepilin-type N-terminal cleavage/methylation domain-containing protein [Flavivirga aquimarina]